MQVTPILVVVQASPDTVDGNPPMPWSVHRVKFDQKTMGKGGFSLSTSLSEALELAVPTKELRWGYGGVYSLGFIEWVRNFDQRKCNRGLLYVSEIKLACDTQFAPSEHPEFLELVGFVQDWFNSHSWKVCTRPGDEISKEQDAILSSVREWLKDRQRIRECGALRNLPQPLIG